MANLPYEMVNRSIHYYELHFSFEDHFNVVDDDPFREFFSEITKLARTKHALRYQSFGEKLLFIQDIKFVPADKKIIGKLRCVRKDILPEIMNMVTDNTKGMEIEDEEGIVETTHFVIDHSKKIKKLAIEYNLFGAKIGDFLNYCLKIGEYHAILKEASYRPIVKDELSKMKDRIKKISNFYVRIHKNNIDQIQQLDRKLHSAVKASIAQYTPEYAELNLKFNAKQQAESQEIRKSIFNLVGALSKNKEKAELFNVLRVKAENAENNYKSEIFDLLVNKVVSELKVQKRANHRTIITEDIFEKIQLEMTRKKI